MRFAICNELFRSWAWDRAFDYAASLGYTGIEVAPFTMAANVHLITPAQRADLRSQASRSGLQVVGLHWLLAGTEGYYLTSPQRDVRQRTGDYFRALAQLCRDLGGDLLVLGSPQQRNLLQGVTMQQALDYASEVIESALPTLEQCAVTLALEPLGPSEGDFLLTADEASQLASRFTSPYVRLHLDVKAMSSERSPIPDIIRRHSAQLAHFHANDPNRRGPGMGEMDFVPILAALREVNYAGWISVEVFDETPGIEALAAESIRYLRQCAAEFNL